MSDGSQRLGQGLGSPISEIVESTDQKRAFVLIEPVHKDTHPIIPELHATVMKGSRKERLSRVEGKSLGDVENGSTTRLRR